jgi:hypothetical protein
MSTPTLNAAQLRADARRVRANAFGADCLWQAAWLERLAGAVEAADAACAAWAKAWETAEEQGRDPERATTVLRGSWERAVNHRDKVERETWIP